MGMFGRAAQNQNLAPLERAVLRFLQTVVIAGLLSGVQAVMPLLNGGDPNAVNWSAVGHTFLVAFLVALGSAFSKYWTAQGDPPLTADPTEAPTPAPADSMI